MKLKIFLFFAVATATLLSGCKKDEMKGEGKIWDIAPIVMRVSVVDKSGNDLLDQTKPGTIDVKEVKALYDGKEYMCGQNSRAYMPSFNGLQFYNNDEYFKCNILIFGEFDGATNCHNRTITLQWPDGTWDKVSFNNDFRWARNGDPEIKRECFLNGVKTSEQLIRIVK